MSDITATPTNLSNMQMVLKHAARSARGTSRRAAVYCIVWQWLAVVAGLFVLDLIVGLPAWARWIGLIGQVLFLIVRAYQLFARGRRAAGGDEWAARMVEERHPEMDNALIHAVQFARSRSEVPDSQARLIERELQRAARAATAMSGKDSISSEAEQTALKRMAIMLCAWAVVGVAFSSGFMAIMPRLLLPWLDEITPPYSPTHFDVRPQGATVRFEDSLAISVKISGKTPENLSLMTQSGKGEWHRIALESEAPNAYTVKLDSLREDTAYYVQGSTGRSAQYHITVMHPPSVTAKQATYSYPAYTMKRPLTVMVGADPLHGLAGTRVSFRVASNRTLKAGALEVTTVDGKLQRLPMTISGGSSATGIFSIERPGTYKVSLTAEDDQSTADAAHGEIKLDHDQRPTVWFTVPGQDLLVTQDMRVPIHIKANDDIAVQRIEFHHHKNAEPDAQDNFAAKTPAPDVEQDEQIDLKACGAHAGDTISYFATAFDNAPGTPNVGETEVYNIKVVTPEEFAEALKEERQASILTQEAQDMAGALRSLAEQQQELAATMERLQKEMAAKPGDAGLKQQLADAQAKQKELQTQAADTASQLEAYSKSPSGTKLEEAIKQKIAQIASALRSASNGPMQDAQSGPASKSASDARKALNQLNQLSKEMQQQVLKALDNIGEVLPLFEDLNRFKELLQEQRQLAQKAQSFQASKRLSVGDRARMTLLADTQSRIARDLSQVQKDLIEHAATAEEHFPKAAASARRIAAEIESRGIVAFMDAGRDKFREWDGPAGYDNVQSALAQMEAMVQKCEGQGGQAGMQGELDISLKECLGQSNLGNCLSQFGVGSQGMANGAGMGEGTGGQNGAAERGGKAYVPSVASASGTGGNKRMRHANHAVPLPDALSSSEIEVVKSPASKALPKAGDLPGSGYPVEYRTLIHEYYRSVGDKQ